MNALLRHKMFLHVFLVLTCRFNITQWQSQRGDLGTSPLPCSQCAVDSAWPLGSVSLLLSLVAERLLAQPGQPQTFHQQGQEIVLAEGTSGVWFHHLRHIQSIMKSVRAPGHAKFPKFPRLVQLRCGWRKTGRGKSLKMGVVSKKVGAEALERSWRLCTELGQGKI